MKNALIYTIVFAAIQAPSQYAGSGSLALGDGEGNDDERYWDDYDDGCCQCDNDSCVLVG